MSTFHVHDATTLEKVHEFTSKNHYGAAVKAARRGMKKMYIRKTGDSKVKVYKGSLKKGPNVTVFRFDNGELPCAPSRREKKKQQLLAKHSEAELANMGMGTFVTFRKDKPRVTYEQSFVDGEDVVLIRGRTARG
jgi:hypothetical protein